MHQNNKQKPVLLSGAKPSGEIHIGNYIGAIKQWIALQDTHETYVPIVDLHALTEPQDPTKLREQILTTAADYVALGLDPQKATIFLQSTVPEHTQLMWVLNTITSMGDLERMVVYKEKIAEGKQALAGLFTYPVLMAADILLYKPSVVPVGEDQRQHVELTRTIARKFNKRFGQTFPIPKELHPEAGKKILSLQDPTKKMSKSHSALSYIAIGDAPEKIGQKIKSAVTDSGNAIKHDPITKPAISNLMTIYSAFSGKEFKDIEKEFLGATYKKFKEALAELVVEKLKPVQEKRKGLLENKEKLFSILEEGATKARVKASETLREVYEKVGLTIH
ncbi:MAG: tryptophan--tRNA ligase [Candidatus Ryanbacteria bacterium RIFCSPHIGHO2_02_FULL_45_17b]|uniref:Tryptophan--tRNA ligase n=1 Tax=Candidatus Ryanbacteria bacterium RIFCSPHIGHO2_01_FULL_45_22 TaxID=1802114 RepID=A0A1G2G2S3_9BACT|nr:MAG: tryptophan--tRNA ligase [Candidatus Ryanbacteria bacterium RIFCSPHIGHO2_01_FULL_45_22]OGZ47631.1 MAG: tryptophan--tRNA ligase [Candidatus Ryanbacteria bacterium RIFCSPHIGHO2_02_FULL_45_17b]